MKNYWLDKIKEKKIGELLADAMSVYHIGVDTGEGCCASVISGVQYDAIPNEIVGDITIQSLPENVEIIACGAPVVVTWEAPPQVEITWEILDKVAIPEDGEASSSYVHQ